MVSKGSSFVDFVRLHPHTYARTQQFLPPLWAAMMYKDSKVFEFTNFPFKTRHNNIVVYSEESLNSLTESYFIGEL